MKADDYPMPPVVKAALVRDMLDHVRRNLALAKAFNREYPMPTTKPTTPKTRNPQDATLRNIRALKARVKKLEERFMDLYVSHSALSTIVGLMRDEGGKGKPPSPARSKDKPRR